VILWRNAPNKRKVGPREEHPALATHIHGALMVVVASDRNRQIAEKTRTTILRAGCRPGTCLIHQRLGVRMFEQGRTEYGNRKRDRCV